MQILDYIMMGFGAFIILSVIIINLIPTVDRETRVISIPALLVGVVLIMMSLHGKQENEREKLVIESIKELTGESYVEIIKYNDSNEVYLLQVNDEVYEAQIAGEKFIWNKMDNVTEVKK